MTTNPLDHFSGGGRKHSQQTIVVQQPTTVSSADTSVSTVLLKNGVGEFLPNVQHQDKSKQLKQNKEDNMKQLLDVANNLTLEEIHDFEMR